MTAKLKQRIVRCLAMSSYRNERAQWGFPLTGRHVYTVNVSTMTTAETLRVVDRWKRVLASGADVVAVP